MAWIRLDPTATADALAAEVLPDDEASRAAVIEALTHLRDQLLSGTYVAVQDHEGHTFIGTPAEAFERMMVCANDPAR